MSDEQDPSEIFRAIFGLPDEETLQKQKMAVTAEVHEIYSWFSNADKESLQRLKSIVGSIITASNGHSGAVMQAAFWQGYVAAKLEDHHSICAACGVNHMDELTTEQSDED